MTSSALSAMLQLQGLPPLPRSLTGYGAPLGPPALGQSSLQPYSHPPHIHQPQPLHPQSLAHSHGGIMPPLGIKSGHLFGHGRPSPVPPPRPQSRRSSSSGSSFRASPDHLTNRSSGLMGGSGGEMLRSSPRSLSSSPHSPHVDSGLGRSSADSSSERAFVRVKSPPVISSRLDAQFAQLKEDMNHLRQQDMALLGHLLQIHQGIQELRQVLLPPPVPAPSAGVLPMFHSTPSPYHWTPSRHPPKAQSSKGHQSQSQSSRLSILSSGATSAVRFFSRRSSSDKLMAEAMGLSSGDGGGMRSGHGQNPRRRDDESDSLSSLEFGDV